MKNIEFKIDAFLEELEKNIKKRTKDKYIDIVEREIKKELDKTSLNEKETKVNEIKKEISNSLQINKNEKIEDFMKKLNREIKIIINNKLDQL